MHSWLEISRSALQNNFNVFRSIGGSSTLAPVLKSNAYGHGLKEVYEALASEKLEWLCVAYLNEAKELRQLGYEGRILMVAPVFESEFSDLEYLQVDIMLTHFEQLDAWVGSPNKPRVHLKIDTGLTRQGFLPEQAEELCRRLGQNKPLIVGICTHFANVEDVLEHDYADQQILNFKKASDVLRKHGFNFIEHCASSASSLILAPSRFDLLRVGVSMYGLWPSPATRLSYLQINTKIPDLRTALTWKTSVAMLKKVKAGAFIGYGCTYRALKDMQVAVLPMGYNEGYPRLAGDDKSYVLIRGQRCPLVGRISMNLMVVDVSHLQTVHRYDEVVLIGRSGNEEIDASRLAGWANTIHYELVTRIHPSLPRKLVP